MGLVTIKSETLTVEINTLGAEIKSVKNNNKKEFMWCGNKEIWSGTAPVLFPICGGLKEDKYIYKDREYSLPKHGFAKLMEFEVESVSDDEVVFLLKADENTLKQYPFDFELRIDYKVTGNRIQTECIVKNKGSEPMYFSQGCHEGYSCPEGIEEYMVVFEETEALDTCTVNGSLITDRVVNILNNEKVLALKTEYFTVDALIFKNPVSRTVTLQNKEGTNKIKVSFPDYPNLLLWTIPGAGYLCIEPWCGMPDIEGSGFDFTKKEGIVCIEGMGEKILKHTVEFSE